MPYIKKSGLLQQIDEEFLGQHGWEEFICNEKCKVFRKSMPCGIYEYRGKFLYF